MNCRQSVLWKTDELNSASPHINVQTIFDVRDEIHDVLHVNTRLVGALVIHVRNLVANVHSLSANARRDAVLARFDEPRPQSSVRLREASEGRAGSDEQCLGEAQVDDLKECAGIDLLRPISLHPLVRQLHQLDVVVVGVVRTRVANVCLPQMVVESRGERSDEQRGLEWSRCCAELRHPSQEECFLEHAVLEDATHSV